MVLIELLRWLVTASPVMTKSRAPAGGNNYPENSLVKPPRRDTRALSPAGMFGGKLPLRLQRVVIPSKISGVGTIFWLLVHVLPGPNKQRQLKPS